MTTINRFYHFVMNKIHKMCQKRQTSFPTATRLTSGVDYQATVCFSCGVGAPTIMILFTLSPTTVTYIKPQRTCKSSTLDELTFICVVHCLKDLFMRRQQHRHRQNNIQI